MTAISFFNLFKREPKAKVKLSGFENGKKIKLPSVNSDDNEDTYYFIRIQPIISEKVKPIEDIIVDLAVELKHPQTVDHEIVLLESIINSYNNLEKLCYSYGPDLIKYFIDFWDTARKDKPNGPSYINRYRVRLSYMKENYETLMAKETIRKTNLINLDAKLLKYLSLHQPILQSDLYKAFDPSIKKDIQKMLYFFEQGGTITREKRGNSYLIYLK